MLFEVFLSLLQDAVFCFLFALLLLVVGILTAVTVWTSCSVSTEAVREV